MTSSKYTYFPRFSFVLFGLCLLGMALLYNYHKIGRMKPTSIHQWRQADCWSFAVNYYNGDGGLLTPELHYIGKSETGKASGEFPIIYYTVGQIWKLTGPKAWIFRGINVLIVFAGLFALFKLAEKILRNTWWALMLSLLLFTSPILVFYTNNFIADAPALGFSLIGAWFFFGFFEKRSLKNLWIACLFFALGALLKVTAAMLFIAVLCIFFVELFGLVRFKNTEKLFNKPLQQGLPLLTAVLVSFAWYAYSAHYNNMYNGEYFLLGIWPVWRMDYPLINEVARILNENLVYQFFSIPVLLATISMLGLMLVFRKKANRILFFLSVLLTAGGIAYMVLWFRVFDVHDYYLLNLLIIVIALMLTFFTFIRNHHPALLYNKGLMLMFALFLAYNIYFAAVKTNIKYERRIEYWEYSFLNRTNELEYWRWLHWYSETYLRAYETVTPYLRSLGIERTDRVISINDHSPNISLALMDQKGVTDFGNSITDSLRIFHEIERGAQYLIVNNPEYYQKDFMQPFLPYKMGSHMNIDVFDLRSFKTMASP